MYNINISFKTVFKLSLLEPLAALSWSFHYNLYSIGFEIGSSLLYGCFFRHIHQCSIKQLFKIQFVITSYACCLVSILCKLQHLFCWAGITPDFRRRQVSRLQTRKTKNSTTFEIKLQNLYIC